MSIEFNGKTSVKHPIPETMKAWVLRDPEELSLIDKPIVMPGKAEVLIKIDAVAICATDLDVISHGPPALIEVDYHLIKISLLDTSTWVQLWH